MVRSGMKKKIVVMVMMLMMIVLAQAQYGPPLLGAPPPSRAHLRPRPLSSSQGHHCASKCALSCLLRLGLTPVSYMLCFNLCYLDCKVFPPQSVYNCTSACALSKSTNANTDARDVEGYVDSCYENCRNK